jgi:hypothetical protein
MSNIRAEHYQPLSSQDLARQRLAAGRQEIMLLTHLVQASLVVERSNPLRRIVGEHRELVRNTTVTIVILLSVAAGLLTPHLARALSIY